MRPTRRGALASLAGLSASPLLQAQELVGEPPGRIAPLADLVNVFEVQAMARRKLAENVYATIAGTDRKALERITFRPRLMVDVSGLNLTSQLLGHELFAPIIAGPVSRQQAFHPDGEVATVRGASAAKTLAIVSSRSSLPLNKIVAEAKTPLWFQVYADRDIETTVKLAAGAVELGCKAVCLTVGVQGPPGERSASPLKLDWNFVEQVRQKVRVPLILKGIMNPAEVQLAVAKGVQAIVVSNHGGMYTTGFADPIEVLPAVVDATGRKIPVLIDGSFRRGTDILKALALGASAVLIGRPLMWGLAAYGADGVQTVLEMLQTELARNMAMCGKPDIRTIDRSLVKIHAR